MTLAYVGAADLERIRGAEGDRFARAAAFADACRINVLYMVMRAGSGHLGTSFSCIDLVSWLHLEELGPGDRYFSSKGHDAPALYALLIGLGRLDFALLHSLRRLDGLPGHPDVETTPQVVTNTGSLGMGISKARGFALADALARRERETFVLTGDGELQEGQFWESLQPTANRGVGRITAIVDHNKLQSDTWVSQVSDLGDLERKIAAFGWEVARCDGHDLEAVGASLAALRDRAGADRPKLLIADTVKGRGVDFMEPHELPVAGESLYGFHSGAPSTDDYERALEQLRTALDRRLDALGLEPVSLEAADPLPPPRAPSSPQRLIAAYERELAAAGETHPRLAVLDGDLSLDCGLMAFRARHPDRFFECGIAEQDMVSQAGAMALEGLVPVVHSFACFLSTRPNEQIYNNATEGTKVVYVGSLAGLVPGGPGHSHQSVRDISALGAMPGMALIEPGSEREVAQALAWALDEAPASVYIRLVSVPWELPFEPASERLEPGRGRIVRGGPDALLVAYGPVLLAEAWAACELLAERGIGCGLAALPWLRDVDGDWLEDAAAGAQLVCLDNHYVSGGQGDAVLAALAGRDVRVTKVGVERVPVCGTGDEVLRAHGLDRESIAARVAEAVAASGRELAR